MRMSNRDRIQHAAAEAQAAKAEKAASKGKKKVAKTAAKKTAKKAGKKTTAKGARMKVVWAVYNSQGKPIESFAYPDKDAAISRARELSVSTSRPHEVRDAKVPMETTD